MAQASAAVRKQRDLVEEALRCGSWQATSLAVRVELRLKKRFYLLLGVCLLVSYVLHLFDSPLGKIKSFPDHHVQNMDKAARGY